MRFGIQTYGPRPLWQPDPEGYFRAIARMGYRQLEPCVAIPGSEEARKFGIWSPEDLENRLPLLRELGLEMISVHAFTGDPEAALPEMLRLAKKCGVAQYVLGCPQEITEEVYRAYGESLTKCARALKEQGVQLLLHNNGGEISGRLGGKTAYEFLLDLCGGLVGAQPDIGWLAVGGQDPEAFLWRNEKLIWSLHYKDMDLSGQPKEVPVGKGNLDLLACFQFARAHGIPQVMDMDTCTMEDIENALHVLTNMTFRRDRTSSVLCTLDVDTGELRELRRFPGIVEAPNWPGEDEIWYNADGHIYRYTISGDQVERMDTGSCDNCNNDHVPSPDGQRIAVSHSPVGEGSRVYIADPATGEVELITERAPSYLHGWSPDGKELCYCAFRPTDRPDGIPGWPPGRYLVDVYAISAEGGEEWPLTHGEGFNDGPEYSPDGKHVWFNSTRSGLMQAWRMDRDGSCPTQMTDAEDNNWFPHVSPDGRRVVYLTFRKGELDPHEHLPNMQVALHIMNVDGSGKRKLLDFFGGQGSINVNSWAPDSRRVALVLYELEHC